MPVCDCHRHAGDGEEEQVRPEADGEVWNEELEEHERRSKHERGELKIAEVAIAVDGVWRLRDGDGLADLGRPIDTRHGESRVSESEQALLLLIRRVRAEYVYIWQLKQVQAANCRTRLGKYRGFRRRTQLGGETSVLLSITDARITRRNQVHSLS